MKNINTTYNSSDKFSAFSKKYFNYLSDIQKNIDPNELDKFAEEFLHAREERNTIFVAGNGGSAATATTISK